MKEICKDIKGYKGLYQISNSGKVKSFPRPCTKGGLLKLQFNFFTGYYSIVLCRNGISKRIAIHILVARTFVKGYKKGLQVNHKDGNKVNNNDWNLEWNTGKDNMKHAKEHNLLDYTTRSKPIIQYTLKGKKIKEFKSTGDAARFYGYNRSNIWQACNGIKPTMYKSIWKLKN